MKTLTATTLALLMALSVPAQAEKSVCEKVAGLAESMMEARQSGVSMVDAMGTSGGSYMIERMVVEAYEVHRFKAPVWQETEVAEFRDKWYMACYKSQQGE